MADQRVNDEKNDIIRNAIINHPSFSSSSKPQWQEIANGINAKNIGIVTSGRKVRELWVNYLNPFLNFTQFTQEEMQILQNLYLEARAQQARGQTRMLESGNLQLPLKENGETMSWELILPGRSPNVLKNKYYSYQKYWNRTEQPDQDELYSVNPSTSVEKDDDVSNNYDFYDSDLHERSKRGDSPPPFAFPLTTKFDHPSGAAFGGGGKRKTSRKSAMKAYRKSARKASRKSARKYRKATRK